MNLLFSKAWETYESDKRIEGFSQQTLKAYKLQSGLLIRFFKEMENLKKTLRTYIFDTYMPGPDYVYAKGINWSENFFDNLTSNEIWVPYRLYLL